MFLCPRGCLPFHPIQSCSILDTPSVLEPFKICCQSSGVAVLTLAWALNRALVGVFPTSAILSSTTSMVVVLTMVILKDEPCCSSMSTGSPIPGIPSSVTVSNCWLLLGRWTGLRLICPFTFTWASFGGPWIVSVEPLPLMVKNAGEASAWSSISLDDGRLSCSAPRASSNPSGRMLAAVMLVFCVSLRALLSVITSEVYVQG